MVHTHGIQLQVQQYWLGVFLNILGSICVNFGTNIMKYSYTISTTNTTQNIHTLPASTVPVLPTTSSNDGLIGTNMTIFGIHMTWSRGATLLAIGSIFTFSSFAYASQSLLAALGTLQFISNVIFSRYVLQKEISWRVVIATTLIVLGVVITVSYSNHASIQYTVQDLLHLYDEKYMFFLEILGIVVFTLSFVYLMYVFIQFFYVYLCVYMHIYINICMYFSIYMHTFIATLGLSPSQCTFQTLYVTEYSVANRVWNVLYD